MAEVETKPITVTADDHELSLPQTNQTFSADVVQDAFEGALIKLHKIDVAHSSIFV
jgi:hypothetical protein